MKCYNCGTELIWGGDHDCEDVEGLLNEEHAIVTNLSCPNCGAFHLVYWGHKGEEEESKQQELFKESEMWEHYCEEEKSMMATGKGEPCNWCGKEEDERNT
jgi:hypothetical protein